MAIDQWKIRLVCRSLYHLLAQMLREALIEMNFSKQGTAYPDPLYETFYDASLGYWLFPFCMFKSLGDDY